MTSLPPLPLINDCLFFDNSTLEKLSTCMRSLEYYKLRARIKASSKPSLRFGGALHDALKVRHTDPDFLPAVNDEKVFAKLAETFTNDPCPDEGYRNLNTAHDTLKAYLAQENTSWVPVKHPISGLPIVELPFAVPIARYPHPNKPGAFITLIWTGRLDRTVSEPTNAANIWVYDYKTTSMLGESFFDQQAVSDQFLGYMYGLYASIGVKPVGYVISAICTRPPSKTGKGTTFEERRFYKPWEKVEQWKHNTIHLLQRFFDCYQRGYFPKETSWCVGKYGRCPYYEACDLPTDENALVLLMSNLFVDNTWSPLNLDEMEKIASEQK